MPIAGPAVQNMFLMCWLVVRPRPTSFGTRIVVSESGDILSPKYAPQITAPAAAASERPMTFAMPTKATPSVPAVVHELPVTMPTIGADRRRRDEEDGRVEQEDAVVDDGRDRAGHVPRPDQRTDREQDEDRAHRGRDAADRGVRDGRGGVAVLQRHQGRERGAQQQRDLQRPVGGADPEEPDRQRDQPDQHHDGEERVEQGRRSWLPGSARACRHRPAVSVTMPRRRRSRRPAGSRPARGAAAGAAWPRTPG